MSNNQSQPSVFDAVKGDQTPPPVEGVVLGGLEGVKRRFTSTVVEARIAALTEALDYGEAGLDLILKSLRDPEKPVVSVACRLLRDRVEPHIKQALLKYPSSLFFTTLANWKFENFNPKMGIVDSSGVAYRLKTDAFNMLVQDAQATKIEALVCQMPDRNHSLNFFINVFCAVHKQLTSLKALSIGNVYLSATGLLKLCNLSPILEAYPNLEVLHVCGGKDLAFSPVRHDRLKTLILETSNLVDELDQLSNLNLPALEYLDLWLGSNYDDKKNTTNVLMPILSGKLFPKLRYLGLRGSQYEDKIAYAVAPSAIVNHLMVLDLSQGTLGDKGAEALLKSLAISQLHTLDVRDNYISKKIADRFYERLDRLFIAQPQNIRERFAQSQNSYRYDSVWE